ncbi:Uu.00g111720.m01.CDS01 [Anthostomella pinea]|uniref:Uu.00g111720.m01.CDS01 n=1 Tax=Anthostomella pinea TaxID=933095 RepID=A0AAI8YGD4_9PEZI|nr:Uu.00g111720.m01.CDS01 [Anthostomella pinea]
MVESDEDLLESLGYRQEFRREFTRWSTLSHAISILGVLGSVPASWGSPLAAGGPSTAIWAWFSGSFFSLCIALSVAELVSAYPMSGGMYFITKHVLPHKKVSVAAWMIGRSNFLGQTASVASVGYSVAQMTLAAESMGSVREDGTFAYVPIAQSTVGVSVVIGSVVISIALLVLTPNKLPASEVFGNVIDGSGWNSEGFSFRIGYLSVAWTMTDYDATAHMSEEQQNAAASGPVAIVQAIIISWVFFNACGRAGGLGMWFWVILVQLFTGVTAMLSNTRTCFALARDEALPFSGTLRKINEYTQTPLYSVWSVVLACCLQNLIAPGSVQTINGIYGITAPVMDISYIAFIAARIYYEKDHPISKGPFQL